MKQQLTREDLESLKPIQLHNLKEWQNSFLTKHKEEDYSLKFIEINGLNIFLMNIGQMFELMIDQTDHGIYAPHFSVTKNICDKLFKDVKDELWQLEK